MKTLFHRALPTVLSRGGTGVSYPPRSTPPTHRQAAGGTTLDWGASDVTGDVVVGGFAAIASSAFAGNNIPVLSTNVDHSLLAESNDDVGSSGYQWDALTFDTVTTADNQSGVFSGVTSDTTSAPFMISETFVGSTVDGEPILVMAEIFTGANDGEMNLGAADNIITFPTYAVPSGYTAVYGIIRWDDLNPASTWATATERADTSSSSGPDALMTIATLAGPNSGAGVTMTSPSNSLRIPTGGCFAFIYLVPGT